jgi:hypothetical protein
MRIPMSERKKLSDILLNSERDRLSTLWQSAKPADDLKPIPSGAYRCRIIDGALFNARSGTGGYKLTLEVLEGEHVGRRLWHDIWLTEAAMSLAKRDLEKLGVTSFEQLERPLPDGIVIDARVALRRGDNGDEYNRVSRFDVVGIEPAEPEPFAPGAGPGDGTTTDGDGFDWRTGQQEGGAES